MKKHIMFATAVGMMMAAFQGLVTTAQEKAAGAVPLPAKAAGPNVVRWEYKVTREMPTEELYNQLGEDGWELVSTTVSNMTRGYSVFKRPKR